MADNVTSDEFLVLTDDAGNYYAIPRATVERHKLSGEQKNQLEQTLGEEVSGFSMYQQYMNEYRTAEYQANRRREASEVRALNPQKSELEATSAEEESRTLGQMLTGVWRSLPFLRPASPTGTS